MKFFDSEGYWKLHAKRTFPFGLIYSGLELKYSILYIKVQYYTTPKQYKVIRLNGSYYPRSEALLDQFLKSLVTYHENEL